MHYILSKNKSCLPSECFWSLILLIYIQVKVQVDTIMKVLTATKVTFIVCMQPHQLAGLCELFRKSPGRNLNQKLLRDQVSHL